MPIARSQQINLEATPYYHCYARCARSSFLCGQDDYSGQSFEHRKIWIRDRLKLLTEVFAIDICAYAVMSNHYHIVLHVDTSRAQAWTDEEVCARWRRICLRAPAYPSEEQLQEWRGRLSDVSWFMRFLNEKIAHRANQEDDCKGCFWQNRFKSKALLDQGDFMNIF